MRTWVSSTLAFTHLGQGYDESCLDKTTFLIAKSQKRLARSPIRTEIALAHAFDVQPTESRDIV